MSVERAPRFVRARVLEVAAEELVSTVLLKVEGDIDLTSVHRLTAALDQVDLDGITLLIVDLDEVTFLDIAGLNAVLQLNEECESIGVHLAVIAPRGAAKRVFTLTGAHLELDLVDAAVSSGR